MQSKCTRLDLNEFVRLSELLENSIGYIWLIGGRAVVEDAEAEMPRINGLKNYETEIRRALNVARPIEYAGEVASTWHGLARKHVQAMVWSLQHSQDRDNPDWFNDKHPLSQDRKDFYVVEAIRLERDRFLEQAKWKIPAANNANDVMKQVLSGPLGEETRRWSSPQWEAHTGVPAATIRRCQVWKALRSERRGRRNERRSEV